MSGVAKQYLLRRMRRQICIQGHFRKKHPPPILLPAEMSRRSVATEVVHVSAALVHVVVADPPT
eukprot:1843374-Pleurochrysis_carterae.AAC.1